MNKTAATSKVYVDSISKLGPYDAYHADSSANITSVMPPGGEQDTAALIGLNIANGRVHSISIGGTNPRESSSTAATTTVAMTTTAAPNGDAFHTRTDRAPTTSTFRSPDDDDLHSITRTIPNVSYVTSSQILQPPDFVPFGNSRTNLLPNDQDSDNGDHSSWTNQNHFQDPQGSGSHIDLFLNSYPKSKDFYIATSGTLYPKSKQSSPSGTNDVSNVKPHSEGVNKFPLSHAVALPSDTPPPAVHGTTTGGDPNAPLKRPLQKSPKFNIAQSTTETRV